MRAHPSEPFRVTVQKRGVYLDGAWRFGAELQPYVGRLVEVRPLPDGRVRIVDDHSLRPILAGCPEAGRTPQQEEAA